MLTGVAITTNIDIVNVDQNNSITPANVLKESLKEINYEK